MDQYAGHLNLKRKPSEDEFSLMMYAKRPDLCVLVRNAVLFRGKHVSEEGKLDLAVVDLKQNMRHLSNSYHGQVICGFGVQTWCNSYGPCMSCVP